MARPSEGKLQPKNEECAALGRAFRDARERSGYSLYRLAADMGCSYYIIRRHEAGHTMMRVDDLLTAAQRMRIAPRSLIGENHGRTART